MNAKSLSPRTKPLKNTQIFLKKLGSLVKLSPSSGSVCTIYSPDSFAKSNINSKIHSSSRISLKLGSPCSVKNPSAQSKKFSLSTLSIPSAKNIGEHLLPLPSHKTIELFGRNLSKHEVLEILEYKEIFYLGLKCKKIHPNPDLKNMGFDDKKTDYIIIKGDHIAYQYEIIKVLGSGSFASVCKC